ncbi:MAG: hypothetical protein V2A69_11250 [Pseudomonadota bacterium]
MQSSGGFSRAEIGHILRIINQYHQQLVEAWNEYFGK